MTEEEKQYVINALEQKNITITCQDCYNLEHKLAGGYIIDKIMTFVDTPLKYKLARIFLLCSNCGEMKNNVKGHLILIPKNKQDT